MLKNDFTDVIVCNICHGMLFSQCLKMHLKFHEVNREIGIPGYLTTDCALSTAGGGGE